MSFKMTTEIVMEAKNKYCKNGEKKYLFPHVTEKENEGKNLSIKKFQQNIKIKKSYDVFI